MDLDLIYIAFELSGVMVHLPLKLTSLIQTATLVPGLRIVETRSSLNDKGEHARGDGKLHLEIVGMAIVTQVLKDKSC